MLEELTFKKFLDQNQYSVTYLINGQDFGLVVDGKRELIFKISKLLGLKIKIKKMEAEDATV